MFYTHYSAAAPVAYEYRIEGDRTFTRNVVTGEWEPMPAMTAQELRAGLWLLAQEPGNLIESTPA